MMIQSEVIGMGRAESRGERTTTAFILSSWINRRLPNLVRNLGMTAAALPVALGLLYLPYSSYINDVPNSYAAVAKELSARKVLFLEDSKHLGPDSQPSCRKLAGIVVGNEVIATLPFADKPYSLEEVDRKFDDVAKTVWTKIQTMSDVPVIELHELNSIRVIVFRPSLVRSVWNRMKERMAGGAQSKTPTGLYQRRPVEPVSRPAEGPSQDPNGSTPLQYDLL